MSVARRRALAAGLVALALYASGAALSGHLSPLARRPLLDGLAPPTPYRWVEPPVELVTSNEPPSSGRFKIRARTGGEPHLGHDHRRRAGDVDRAEGIVRLRRGAARGRGHDRAARAFGGCGARTAARDRGERVPARGRLPALGRSRAARHGLDDRPRVPAAVERPRRPHGPRSRRPGPSGRRCRRATSRASSRPTRSSTSWATSPSLEPAPRARHRPRAAAATSVGTILVSSAIAVLTFVAVYLIFGARRPSKRPGRRA